MPAKRRIAVPLLIALCLLGAFLFVKGFLGVRTLIEDKSELSHSIVEPPGKVVIIVIDALRIDFVLPALSPEKQPEAWWNKLTILNELASTDKTNAKLFHFVADPPTATTPRLTGLTAGSLPAFIQVTQNFAEDSLGSDSIVHQLLRNPKYSNLALLGDDTWLSMFPQIREKSRGVVAGYHSFHLFDLNSVDDGIKSHLFPLLQEESDYEVIIAHFLGVDHCGHKYGPSLAPCGDKLSEMDKVIRQVIDLIPSDSLLFVLGDHGMTDEGDHGGNSQKEISTVLFSYRKTSLDSTDISDQDYWKSIMDNVSLARLRHFPELKDKYYFQHISNTSSIAASISQVDFASTFSLLVGVPIPFGNVGCFIPELLIDYSLYATYELEHARRLNWEILTEAARANANQIKKFFHKSGTLGESGFSPKTLNKLTQLFEEATNSRSEKSPEKEFFDLLEFLFSAQQHCRQVWSSFNYYLIYSGLGIMTFSLALLAIVLILGTGISVFTLIGLLALILHSIALFTTSFITFEDWLTRFLLNTLLSLAINPQSALNTFLLLAIVSLSSLFGSCREEQYPWCQALSHRSFTVSLYSYSTLFIAAIFVALLLIILYLLRKACCRLLWITGLMALFVRSHLAWWVDTASFKMNSQMTYILDIILPRCVFVIFGSLVHTSRRGGLLPFAVACFTAITLRPFAALIQVVMTFGFIKLSKFTNEKLNPAFLGAVYYLFGMHLFFITGHQLNFTNLQWEASFVGLRSTVQSIAALLMILNTFSGPIIAAFLVPLHASLYLIFYSLMLLATSMVATAVLMYHLMVWRMFTPRFLLQAAISCIIIIITITRKWLDI